MTRRRLAARLAAALGTAAAAARPRRSSPPRRPARPVRPVRRRPAGDLPTAARGAAGRRPRVRAAARSRWAAGHRGVDLRVRLGAEVRRPPSPGSSRSRASVGGRPRGDRDRRRRAPLERRAAGPVRRASATSSPAGDAARARSPPSGSHCAPARACTGACGSGTTTSTRCACCPAPDRWSCSRWLTRATGRRRRDAGAASRPGQARSASTRRRAQPDHRGGVHLRDAGLGDAEHAADLGEGHALVVVEDDDDALALAETLDRAGQQELGLGGLDRAGGVERALVAEGVAERDAAGAVVAAAEQLVERRDVDRRELGVDGAQVLDAASRGAGRPRPRSACGAASPRARRTRGRRSGPWCGPSAGPSPSRAARR